MGNEMNCQKTVYPSKHAALSMMLKRLKDVSGLRVYYCGECKGYHLTSKAKRMEAKCLRT